MVTAEDRAGCCAPPAPAREFHVETCLFHSFTPFLPPPPRFVLHSSELHFLFKPQTLMFFLLVPGMCSSQRSFSSLLRALCYLSRLAAPIVALCGVATPHMLPFSWFEESQCFGSMLFTYMDCVCEHVCTHSPNSENDLRE